MAGNDYAMRFTEDKYATKLEVGRELKVSSVDPFWSNILSYRNKICNRNKPLLHIIYNVYY